MKATNKNKTLFFIFSVVVSMVILIGATYSWITYSDQRVNAIEGADLKLKIAITGNTHPQVLAPNLLVEKNIQVRNDSKARVFIRVSLKEAMAAFEIDTQDQTGNANRKEYAAMGMPELLLDTPSSWKTGAYFKETNQNRIYKAVSDANYAYEYGEAARPALLKENIQVKLSKQVLPDNPGPLAPVQDHYWLYDKGYFYFSERVYEGNSTSVLLESIGLKEDAPNTIKGSLYTNPIQAEAALANESVYDAWGIPTTASNPIYKMYQKQF